LAKKKKAKRFLLLIAPSWRVKFQSKDFSGA